MNKRYSPVYLHDPESLCHVVRLHPGQDLILQVPSGKDITVNGELLLSSVETNNRIKKYRIIQRSNIFHWALYSTSFLGEVEMYEEDKLTAKVIVMMECSTPSKKNIISVFNPDDCKLKVKPFNVLEVIVHSLKRDTEWLLDWVPSQSFEGSYIEVIGYDEMIEGVSDDSDVVDYLYSRCPKLNLESGRKKQSHYWVRFDCTVLALLERQNGTIYAGKILVYDRSKEADCFSLSLVVDCKPKYKNLTRKALELKKKNEMFSPCQSPLFFNETKPQLSILDVELSLIQSNDLFSDCLRTAAMPSISGNVDETNKQFNNMCRVS